MRRLRWVIPRFHRQIGQVLLYSGFYVPENIFVRIEIAALCRMLKQFGPHPGRPRVETLNGSRFVNMKELRFDAVNGAWRVAFAFDPARRGILLVAGDKSGGSEKRFYRRLIRVADERFDAHLAGITTKGR